MKTFAENTLWVIYGIICIPLVTIGIVARFCWLPIQSGWFVTEEWFDKLSSREKIKGSLFPHIIKYKGETVH